MSRSETSCDIRAIAVVDRHRAWSIGTTGVRISTEMETTRTCADPCADANFWLCRGAGMPGRRDNRKSLPPSIASVCSLYVPCVAFSGMMRHARIGRVPSRIAWAMVDDWCRFPHHAASRLRERASPTALESRSADDGKASSMDRPRHELPRAALGKTAESGQSLRSPVRSKACCYLLL